MDGGVMKRSELIYQRPKHLQATAPAEARGRSRDQGRLLVSDANGHTHAHFYNLPDFFQAGDVLVVNDSATVAASLPASGAVGNFIVNFAVEFGGGVWLVEPRWSSAQPGPMPLRAGASICVGDLPARLIAPYPGLSRLWLMSIEGDVRAAMESAGQPIRYGYVNEAFPLDTYQTVFARVPGSAEMPSAAYPFTQNVVEALQAKGVIIVPITLHTGVSSLEVDEEIVEDHPMYPEPYHVPVTTAREVNSAIREGRRVVAVGTTVVRALESAWSDADQEVKAQRGYTRLYIHPARGVHVVHGLITGLHDPVTSHLAMLYTIAGQDMIREGYAEAIREGYLWHEFGDSHLIWSPSAPARRAEAHTTSDEFMPAAADAVSDAEREANPVYEHDLTAA